MTICGADGCSKKHYAKGYCEKHYWQIKRYGKISERTRFDPNEIVIKNNIAEIILYNGNNMEIGRAVIDAEDVEKVKDYKWFLSKIGYAITYPKKGQDWHRKCVGIQHVIMGLKPNMAKLIDHTDSDRLNNRKSNLRLCTHSENNKNKLKQNNNTSGYRGVHWSKARQRWVSQIKINKKKIHLGVFKDKDEAALKYNNAALRLHGEFACLNLIN